MNDKDATPKKKSDKSSADNITVSLDKIDTKKSEKGETDDPKPRIVLTFRSEKSNTKSSNMKIVSTEEKHEEVSPRRSSRTRKVLDWDWVCDSDTSVSPKKDKSLVSENDESDSSHSAPKRSHRRNKDDYATTNSKKKEKSVDSSPVPTQRPSRRIKPTAKILENEELRIGLESQNNTRRGGQLDKTLEEGVKTRRSAQPCNVEQDKHKQPDVVELDSDSQNSDMKVKHLCGLGLKAVDPEEASEDDTESQEMDDDNDAEMLEDEEEIDDDSEVICKLLEADEDSDEEFLCTMENSRKRPRRSTRLNSSYCPNDSDQSSPAPDDESKVPLRRSRRRVSCNRSSNPVEYKRRREGRSRRRAESNSEQLEGDHDDESNPAGAEEGSEPVCPEDKCVVVAKCYCEAATNVHAAPDELTEPVFCQAIEMVDGVRVGCSHAASKSFDGSYQPMIRAGLRAPFILACSLHNSQMLKHMCCSACGLFCTQGIFYQCSEGHLFHLECGLPYNDTKDKPGCPHCGVYSYRWQPINKDCYKVKVELKCSNKRIFLPDQREQCTQAYLGFSEQTPTAEAAPLIPEELLPPATLLKLLCQKNEPVKCTAQEICEAILARETVEQLLPKIVSGSKINKHLPLMDGGTCVHAAAKCGHLGALYLLHNAGANLSATDNNSRTPLMIAVITLLEKADPESESKANPEDMEVDNKEGDDISTVTVETPQDAVPKEKEEKTEKETGDEVKEAEIERPKDEDMMKIIRYLIAAGCDVNIADQPEALTALHVAARQGGAAVCAALLEAADVDVEARDHGGWSPLVWAAENSHHAALRVLLSHGASALSVDNEGNSAVHWCALAGAALALQTLLQHAPAAANTPNKHTDTPLHVAARHGHYSCVVILLARGARSDVQNAAGELPVDVCSGQCQSAISLNMQMTMALKDKITPYRLLSSDISNGREMFPVPCVNEVDDEPLPTDFTYVTRHVTPDQLLVDNTIQNLQGCSCSGENGTCDADCACAGLCVKRWWRRGRLAPAFPHRDPPMLFQCNATCRCDYKRCSNSVVTRLCAQGATFVRTSVFRAGGARGWGLRALGAAPRGAPLAVYCGELLPLPLADTRTDDTYMFSLDLKPDLLEECVDKTSLCVDARSFGSAARFMNHSCAPNAAPVRVFTESRDLRLPAVTLFALADIRPGDELTFDYGDKFWSVKSKWMKCECGTAECRYPAKANHETES